MAGESRESLDAGLKAAEEDFVTATRAYEHVSTQAPKSRRIAFLHVWNDAASEFFAKIVAAFNDESVTSYRNDADWAAARLKTVVDHYVALKREIESKSLGLDLERLKPNLEELSQLQRLVREREPVIARDLRDRFISVGIPTHGFDDDRRRVSSAAAGHRWLVLGCAVFVVAVSFAGWGVRRSMSRTLSTDKPSQPVSAPTSPALTKPAPSPEVTKDILAAPTDPPPTHERDDIELAIATDRLPDGRVGTPYSQAMMASGGTGQYTWSRVQGNVPGLSLDGRGTWTGIPAATGTFGVQVRLSDGTSSLEKALRVTIADKTNRFTIANSELVAGSVGSSYSQAIKVEGGTGPYSWIVERGDVPGLTLDRQGTLSGTPTTAGVFPLTVRGIDANNVTAVFDLRMTVRSPSTPAPSIPALQFTTPPELAPVNIGESISRSINVEGGTRPYRWTMNRQPEGLTIGPTGVVSGSADVGAHTFAVHVEDGAGNAVDRDFRLSILLRIVVRRPGPTPLPLETELVDAIVNQCLQDSSFFHVVGAAESHDVELICYRCSNASAFIQLQLDKVGAPNSAIWAYGVAKQAISVPRAARQACNGTSGLLQSLQTISQGLRSAR